MEMNDLTLYPIKFDSAGAMGEIKNCISIAFDWLSNIMHDLLCRVISQCSEAAHVMILDAQKQVKELNREINDNEATIEVGIDEDSIRGDERTYVRVMVTLHGNNHIFTTPGGPTWKKHAEYKGPNNVQTIYRIPQFDQADNSGLMMKAFEHDMKKYEKDFMNTLDSLLDSIDFSKYLQ